MDAYVKQADVLEYVTTAYDLISSEIDPLRRAGMIDAVVEEAKRQRARHLRQIAYDLRQKGWTQGEIGDMLGVHGHTIGLYVRDYCAANGIPLPKRPHRGGGTFWKPIEDAYQVQAADEG
jgi:hypothetical protein